MSPTGWHRNDYDCTGDAAAYVLGALEDHELGSFLRHLETCAICRDEVASLQVVVDMLPASVTPVTPPRALRKRVLATVYAEAELFQAAGPSSPVARPRRVWRPVPRGFQALAAAALVAAAVAVAVVALGGPSTPRTRAITANTTIPGSSAVLQLSGSRTELDVTNLPAAADGRVYEVWLQRSGEFHPTNALFTPTSSGSATVAVPGNLHGVEAVLVTDEPPGGSVAPTRTPVISASLQ